MVSQLVVSLSCRPPAASAKPQERSSDRRVELSTLLGETSLRFALLAAAGVRDRLCSGPSRVPATGGGQLASDRVATKRRRRRLGTAACAGNQKTRAATWLSALRAGHAGEKAADDGSRARSEGLCKPQSLRAACTRQMASGT
ncbi:hypothetical protein PHYPSEUDO_000137 [Phytophthora pseudosyringae]|uniref:Uncharacterized protein n=1 Tax=Phytophthora pseudosyringae TaxID=221518 RepID=A0A8T1WQ20_9STRA|nr:hypothetical protein PHYPSEUDO_000137 [Phytophthora pseudosyringae]